MFKPKSFLVLKDRVFCPDYNSHQKMLEELGIVRNWENVRSAFVQGELSPANGDIFSDISTWKVEICQSVKPDWFFEEMERPKVVEAVKAWAAGHIFTGRDGLNLPKDGEFYIKNCKNVTVMGTSRVEAYGDSRVTAMDNGQVTAKGTSHVESTGTSHVEAREDSQVEAWGTSHVEAREDSQVTAKDNSQVTAKDNSRVIAKDNSRVIARDNSRVTARENSICIIEDSIFSARRESIVLMENSTLKDCKERTIYQSGDWRFVEVKQ